MNVVDLSEIGSGTVDLVGGKAAGLGELTAMGEAVPGGFCVTTAAHDRVRHAPDRVPDVPDDLRAEIVDAYRRMGAGPVAVRSSATAEDLPHASFAGQQDTVLGVTGEDAVIEAVRTCWASLWSDRAVRYREDAGIDHGSARMAVVVQHMVDAQVAGVLFTANPLTGTRAQMVVDAASGLGTAVVDGTVTPDHYVLDDQPPAETEGCLSATNLAAIHAAGRRLERHFGAPQDVEWAIDASGGLWLLQSRAITTLFPLPQTSRPAPRVYLSASAAQGVLQPMTPMGMSAMRLAGAGLFRAAGIRTDPIDGPEGVIDVGGRMYMDMTDMVRSKRSRGNLRERIGVQGPRVAAAVERVLADPRFAPRPGLPFRARSVAKVVLRYAVPATMSMLGTLARPDAARQRAYRHAAELERVTTAPADLTSMRERLRFVEDAGRTAAGPVLMKILWPLCAGKVASWTPAALLRGIAEDGEVDTVLRGMPHNPTIEMDLSLWRLATTVGDARELLVSTPPEELAARYARGTLPDIGLEDFLDSYGRRAVAEIDLGVPRWAEEPTAVLAAIAGYLRVTDPEQGPDRRFARAAAEAEAKIDDLVRRARATRPLRARLAGVLLRRARCIAGLRELPKFCWLHALAEMRAQLLLVGDELARAGLLDRPDDVMFLRLREAQAAVGGADLRALVAERRATHEREMRRHNVPSVLLSDGTDPETLATPTPAGEGVLTGMAAAPGVVTGRARVVRDPAGARVEPGEILVAPSTDPGWTPLFMTAGGLVTETGAPVSHGPTVAREYGIPAVIGVRDATRLIRTGQEITVDGAGGTVATCGADADADAVGEDTPAMRGM